jgi:Sigma-70 region 2
LLAAAKCGDRAAFDELFQPLAKRTLQIVYRITRNREDAQDALQDSFLRALRHIEAFESRSSFSLVHEHRNQFGVDDSAEKAQFFRNPGGWFWQFGRDRPPFGGSGPRSESRKTLLAKRAGKNFTKSNPRPATFDSRSR